MSANVRSAVRLTVFGAAGLLAAACDQPTPKCTIARGNFAARYTLVSGTGDCATLVGEQIAADAYYQQHSAKDPQANLNKGSIALQPESITGPLFNAQSQLLDTADPATQKPYALGAFDDKEPDKDFCMVPTLAPAHVVLPEVPEHVVEDDFNMCSINVPYQPAMEVTYVWSNVKVYVTPGAYGSQFAADLVYSTPSCSATYRVTAVYPATSCGVDVTAGAPAPANGDPDAGTDAAVQSIDSGLDLDAASPAGPAEDPDGGVVDAVECPTPGPQVADNTLCVTDTKSNLIGSGLNSDFATVCDPVLLLCVIDKEPPSLNK